MKTHKMTNEHPLRGVVACPYCERKFTSWNTSKYRIKNDKRIKKLYPYYGCANPNCKKRVNLGKSKLENSFYKLLE